MSALYHLYVQTNFPQHIKKSKYGIKKSITHRFLLPQQFRKGGHMDTCRQDVNMEDDRSNFLSRGQVYTWKQKINCPIRKYRCT